MNIINADSRGKTEWNGFIQKNYPPIGAFMQTWEWGEFQKNLGRPVARHYVIHADATIAAFALVRYSLPLGFSYGYAPRGPTFAKGANEEHITRAMETIRLWALIHPSRSIFIRLEPPLASLPAALTKQRGFFMPPYYIQPRHNLATPLDKPESGMLADLHPSTRSNLARAERRGVTIAHAEKFTKENYAHFSAMMKDTIRRNSGTNAYPSPAYFSAFLKTIPPAVIPHNPNALSLDIINGYQHGELAATHIVLYFGDTATYLYGAAYTKHLSSKVTTCLHWQSALEAKRRGLHYYDLGGVDAARWPSLTAFKRQFRGKEFSYAGNIDIPIKPMSYALYNLIKKRRM